MSLEPQIDHLMYHGIYTQNKRFYQSLKKEPQEFAKNRVVKYQWIIDEYERQALINHPIGVGVNVDFVIEEFYRCHPEVDRSQQERGVKKQQIQEILDEFRRRGIIRYTWDDKDELTGQTLYNINALWPMGFGNEIIEELIEG
jgi:hypothetical protein